MNTLFRFSPFQQNILRTIKQKFKILIILLTKVATYVVLAFKALTKFNLRVSTNEARINSH